MQSTSPSVHSRQRPSDPACRHGHDPFRGALERDPPQEPTEVAAASVEAGNGPPCICARVPDPPVE